MKKISNLTFKKVFTYEKSKKKVRLFRLMWRQGDPIHNAGGSGAFSAKLAVALRPVLFRWEAEPRDYRLILAGVDIHYRSTYGGLFV